MLSTKRSVLTRLLSVLSIDVEADLRRSALRAVGAVDHKRATRAILNILENESEDPFVRGEAAETLGTLNDSKAVEPLIRCLNSNEGEVRFWSAFALGSIADRRALPFLVKRAAIETAEIAVWGSIRKEILWASKEIRRAMRSNFH